MNNSNFQKKFSPRFLMNFYSSKQKLLTTQDQEEKEKKCFMQNLIIPYHKLWKPHEKPSATPILTTILFYVGKNRQHGLW